MEVRRVLSRREKPPVSTWVVQGSRSSTTHVRMTPTSERDHPPRQLADKQTSHAGLGPSKGMSLTNMQTSAVPRAFSITHMVGGSRTAPPPPQEQTVEDPGGQSAIHTSPCDRQSPLLP